MTANTSIPTRAHPNAKTAANTPNSTRAHPNNAEASPKTVPTITTMAANRDANT